MLVSTIKNFLANKCVEKIIQDAELHPPLLVTLTDTAELSAKVSIIVHISGTMVAVGAAAACLGLVLGLTAFVLAWKRYQSPYLVQ